MKLKFSFIENLIEFSNDYVRCLEIENKKYFYRVVELIDAFSHNQLHEDIRFFEGFKCDHVKVVIDYFHLDYNSKSNLNALNKEIVKRISVESTDVIHKYYCKILSVLKKELNDINLSIDYGEAMQIDKLVDFKVKVKSDLLENLLSLIDLYRELNKNAIFIFVNLKSYLSSQELIELYKYAIYNQIVICLIDSLSYGVTLSYEKKIIIDENLDEFVLE